MSGRRHCLVVASGVVGPAAQNVLADGGGEDPGLLRRVRPTARQLQRTTQRRQLAEQHVQQRTLRRPNNTKTLEQTKYTEDTSTNTRTDPSNPCHVETSTCTLFSIEPVSTICK